MSTQTFLLIILAAVIALGIALFQYYYRTRTKGKLTLGLAFLRFLAFFGAFLLLINPKFTKNEYVTEKAELIVLTDNSSSVANFQKDIDAIIKSFEEHEEIKERFNVRRYSFGSSLKATDSLSFAEKNTDISKALAGLKEIYAGTNSTIVLLSDGNQTLGRDYSFYREEDSFPVYPIAIGDTTQYEDLAISQVNTNRYAFLKNKYPVEIYASYFGDGDVKSEVKIAEDGKTVFREQVTLSNTSNTKVVNALIDANSVGIKNVSVSIGVLPNERNRINNTKVVAIEVIDEKTNIAIVSNILHPDIGALKKAIERNEQRSVSIKKPTSNTKAWENVDLFVLYQPDPSFKTVYDYVQQKKSNILTITGTQTNWNFLNRVQKTFVKNSYNQSEEVFPVLNQGFDLFNNNEFSIIDFPPLASNLGEIVLNKQGNVLLTQRIKGATLKEPLLAFFDDNLQREAVLFGENSWKWRVQSYRNEQNFENFDGFIGKVMLYLATNKAKERLTLDYESVYSGSSDAKISAAYFDETFIFDANAMLTIKVKNTDSKTTSEIPMLLKGNYYESDLSNLAAGTYEFTVSVKNENLSKSGSITILDFDVEKQFLSTDDQKLSRLAKNTNGALFYPAETSELLSTLLEDSRFVPTQKSKQNVVPLVDFRILLAIIAIALAAEWFIRKYNGLI